MRQEFWPIHGKRVVDCVLRKCYRCFRINPAPVQQPTGQLPGTRVRPSRPFSITGVDYCGPFYLKPPHRRAAAPKSYISVFICFSTKAIHLEIVSDLSTTGFISALRRFSGHHGIPTEIHSDNAKNFAGAKNELHDLYHTLNDKSSQERIGNELSLQGITWKYLNALTPAHFLIGTPMNAIPERNLITTPANRLDHHQQQQQMFQKYWDRWSRDYLTELQTCSKYKQPSPIRIGTLVVLREDNMPPLCWPLARITDVHPSAEGVVRVVTVKTASGVYKRPVCRICPLPSETVIEEGSSNSL
ncbi:uncharacterized protein LOC134208964 [Armigeres subalbatus]|uniref:uncharacterized protein LOC134208964 n=1 Tax=Armigeres subalbatus TaxID=124917 RepID=UPI002ED2A55A